METEYLIFGGVISGLITAVIADRKGRSVVGWGVLGFVFGIFAIIVCALMPRRQPSGMSY